MLSPSGAEIIPSHCADTLSLAYAEMRLILTRLLWNFDLELDERSQTWVKDLKAYSIWQKEALYVKLKPVVRD
jgi:hypothetical protein